MKLRLGLPGMTATIAAAGIAAFTLPARADSVADDTLATLGSLRMIYRSSYAPSAWKKQFTNYDLNAEYASDIAAIQANPNYTYADAKHSLQHFIDSMRDYHTSIQFNSTEEASLPFVVQAAGDRYFIMVVNRAKLSKATFPFEVGDELVSMDGRPTKDIVAELQNSTVENVASTDKMIATMHLTSRKAAGGLKVPQGLVVLGIKRKGQSTVTSYQMAWTYSPEQIRQRGDLIARRGSQALLAEKPTLSHAIMAVPKMASKMADGTPNPFGVGAPKSFTPDLGTRVWSAPQGSAFDAYVYKTPDRRLIGYVRIESYIRPDKNYVKAVADFGTIIKQFESTTDGMVIDQVNNGGGSVAYLYALASMLTDQPLKTPRHHIKLNQGVVADALELIEKLKDVKSDDDAVKALGDDAKDGTPTTFQRAQMFTSYAKALVSDWNAGRTLSNPTWIEGVDTINPSLVTQYTKPILILTNGLDFSGADFFPTIMQDNKRATIMGTRTAGAGGFILNIDIPNNLGIAHFVSTASIAERLDGNPIENLGVTPDVPYAITAEDYQNNFAGYVKAINDQISKMTP